MNPWNNLLRSRARLNHYSPPSPSGPTRVGVVQWASGPTNGYTSTYSMVSPEFSIQAGDLIVAMMQTLSGSSPNTPPMADSPGGNSWTTDYNNTASTRDAEYVYHAIASEDVENDIATLSLGGNIYGQYIIAVYRAPAGKTWHFDSANFSVFTNGFNSSAISRTLNTSGPGIIGVMCNAGNADNGATYGLVGVSTNCSIQAECPPCSSAGIGYFSFYADYLSSTSLSSYTVSGNIYSTIPGDTANNKDFLVAPFYYD